MNSKPTTPPFAPRIQRLLEMIVALKEKESLAELGNMLNDGVDPKTLLACCMEGMRRIGDEFEKGTYYIAALIMAGEIMRAATELLSPYLTQLPDSDGEGTVMIGTIQGDIHDLGKNLFALLLKCHSFKIIDLGVDVSKETFLERATAMRPDIIGISCVLTNSLDTLKEAVASLKDDLPHPQVPILIGGTCLDARLARHIGPAIWAKDAAKGLTLCKKLLMEHAFAKAADA
jgi:methanogenic corrinoid protein MtbC1